MRILIFYLTAIVFASCSSVTTMSTNVSIKVPAEKRFDFKNNSKKIVVASVYNDFRSDSMIKLNYPTDSAMLVTTAFSLIENLEDSPDFTNEVFEGFQLKRNETRQSAKRLNPEDLSDVQDISGADYFISVEYFKAEVWYMYGKVYNPEELFYYNEMQNVTPYTVVFRIYDSAKNVLDETVINDTVTYAQSYAIGFPHTEAFKLMPDIDEAVIEACKKAGSKYAAQIASSTENDIRYYYKFKGDEVQRASDYIKTNQWVKANEIWMKYVDDPDNTNAGAACFNTALGCEMLGEYKLALEWLKAAKNKNSKYGSKVYEQLLNKRLVEK